MLFSLYHIKKFLLSLFFPKFCLGCQRDSNPPSALPAKSWALGSYLCEDCKATLEISGTHQKANLEWLSDLYFALDYQKPLIKKLIRSFKYEPFVKELAKPLVSLIIEHFQLMENPPPFFGGGRDFVLAPIPLDSNPPTTLPSSTGPLFSPRSEYVLIPVPLDRKKLKWRGFNQAEEMAKELAKFLKTSLLNNVLVKTKETLPQVELSENERRENIKGVFLVKNKELVANKKILLVDDIYTTGSTMEEAARILKEAGAKEIIGIVVARATPGTDKFQSV